MKLEIVVVLLFFLCIGAWMWRIGINIEWANCIATLVAVGLGSWLAYLLNLRQQKIWDKERKEEDAKKERDEQVLQLNYLQTCLHYYVDELYTIYNKLNYKQKLYGAIQKNSYQLTPDNFKEICVVFADFSSKFKINWKDLSFAACNSEFIYVLASVDTAIHRFVNSHSFGINCFHKDIIDFKRFMAIANKENKFDIVKEFIDKQIYNNGEEIFLLQYAVSSIDEMLQIFEEYVSMNNYQNRLAVLSYSSNVKEFVQQAKREVRINESK